ncbi:MAG: glucose 1-dehydrogenase [Paracoccaceae bacterium]|nr:glucose 1-dehydrogenase [Paracoccaceae bacterium]
MFKDKSVIVTGGASGIGLEVASRFAKAGANVVINGRDPAKLEAAAQSIGATAVAGDIGDIRTAQRIVTAAEKAYGGVDILINNAGIFSPKPFLEQTEAEYDAFVDTILKGKFFMAQAAAKSMIARGGGAIVQTGSMWALQAIGATPSAAYSAANAGVHQMVRNLALELASHKIRINAVAPAVVETPVYNTFLSEEEVATTLPTFNAFHPLGRNGQPSDIAEAILFLASENAGWITGTVLPVDGGVMAGRN